MKHNGINIKTGYAKVLELLSDIQAGRLFKAILCYADNGTCPVMDDDVVKFEFARLRHDIDEELAKRHGISEKRKQAAESRWDTQLSRKRLPKKSVTSIETLKQRTEVRKNAFYNSLIPFVSVYGKEMVRDFYDYWVEPNKSQTKMRFELEKTWDLSRRLSVWASRAKIDDAENRRHNSQEQRTSDAAKLVNRLLDEN